jgi:excisionase family DNA binding protein
MNKNTPPLGEWYLLTVVQAAQQLSIHPSTIRRWIDQGRLPAYRVGEKRIGVKPSDLAKVVTPLSGRHRQAELMVKPEEVTIPSLTDTEQRRALQALAELRRLREELAAKYGNPSQESWELLSDSRDERTHDMLRGVQE